jgi:hypothetical protein
MHIPFLFFLNEFFCAKFQKKNILINFFDLVYAVLVSNIYILTLPIRDILCCVIG